MYVYVCVSIYIYIYLFIYLFIHTHIYVYAYVCVCVCVCIYIYMHISNYAQIVCELPLLPNNTASEIFLHTMEAVRSVDCMFVIGVLAWR